MSREHREKAKAIIRKGIDKRWSPNLILNVLMRNGYTNDLVKVDVAEVKEDLEKAAFKCKVDCGPDCFDGDE